MVYLELIFVALLNIAVTVFLYLLDGKTAFGKLKYGTKQMITGIVFGILSVCGTEFGVNIGGAILNVRDTAPLCAGLIFGGPAGIIAGITGGVERWFAVLWGAGTYTRLACSISTVLAGFIAAALRKLMFDNKKPAWQYGLAIAAIVELIHMLMIFVTNMSDVHTAFEFVKKCTAPMVLVNGLAVMTAVLLVSIIGKENRKSIHELKKISQTFQHWLLICVIIAFLATTAFLWKLQTGLSENDATGLLELNIRDVEQDVMDVSDENLLKITRNVADEINRMENVGEEQLKELREKYNVAEINIINRLGIITVSTFPEEFLNYNMKGGKQSAEFLVLLDGKTKEYVQSYQPTSSNSEIMRKYAGIALENGGFVQVAYDAERFQQDIDAQVIGVTRNRHVGEDGCIIIADEKGNIVSDRNNNEGKQLEKTGIHLDIKEMKEGEKFDAEVYGRKSYCMYLVSEGYSIIAVLPQSEAVFTRDVSVYVTVFMEMVIFGILFVLIYYLIKRLIVDNIRKVNESLAEITGGNLDVVVDVRSNEEFASLSDDINSTVVTLKCYIEEAAARIDQELEFAKAIQHSALPGVFPPYPNRTDLDIYADMMTAKEVGGDFYDFYFVGEDRLAFLIADVSGKGIPAAMFMMTAKTLIKSLAESGLAADQVFTTANNKLCEGNDAGMFVTAWFGILDLKTGDLEYVNGGHNPPLLCRESGSFAYLESQVNFVLAGMEGIAYEKDKLMLQPGDKMFLYTDGVTEAMNKKGELYSEERLCRLLNAIKDADAELICKKVKEDVDRFVGDALQFDDITMLALCYQGSQE